MRSRSVSPVGTLLTIVAVLAVPLLAIFGIPQFMPVVASPSLTGEVLSKVQAPAPPRSPAVFRAREIFAPVENQTTFPAAGSFRQTAGDRRQHGIGRGRAAALESGWSQPVAPSPAVAPSHHSIATSPVIAPARAGRSAGPPEGTRTRSVGDRRPAVPMPNVQRTGDRVSTVDPAASTTVPAPTVLTWKQAIQRLNALGIRHYRLQPGRRVDTFYFCCYVHPTSDPRVAVRFEWEADDPLKAVHQVLIQVTEWYQKNQ